MGCLMMNNNPYVLSSQLAEICLAKGISIALAESCTGGLLSAWMTEAPGASAWFYGSACVYSNAAKASVLAVDPALIAAQGAVSEPVAAAMAKGAQSAYQSTLSLSITGIAGPRGGSLEKPVGTVCFGLYDARSQRCQTKTLHFTSGRTYIRECAAKEALLWLTQVATTKH